MNVYSSIIKALAAVMLLLPSGYGDGLQVAPRSNGFRENTPSVQVDLDGELQPGAVHILRLRARAGSPFEGPMPGLRVLLAHPDRMQEPIFRCGPVVNENWMEYAAPFRIPEDASVKDSALFLVHGWGGVPIEVEDVRIEAVSGEAPLSAFAWHGRWYEGQAPHAPWRAKAQAMIEQHRKGELRITVVDRQGRTLPGVRIIAEQQQHAYRFGTAVNSLLFPWLADDAASNHTLQAEFEAYRKQSGRKSLTFLERQAEIRRYFEVLQADFNYAVLENALKWQAWSGDWGGFRRENTLACIDWLNDRGLEVKAHALVWPGWRQAPHFLRGLTNEPPALSHLIDAHIADIGSAVADRVVAVDVLNEAFNNHDFMDVLGEEVVGGWFYRARAVFPDAQLNMNDFQIFANGGRWMDKIDFYDALTTRLLREGAPLDALGFQNHYRHTFLTPPRRIWELADRLGRHGLPLVCSEFDVNLADEELQAAYARDFLTAWFAHPDTEAFLFWGFWQDSHWLPYGALYDRDWRMKPIAAAYRELIHNTWWSGWEEKITNAGGQAVVRAFLGTYRISIYHEGSEKVLEEILLDADGTALTVRLD